MSQPAFPCNEFPHNKGMTLRDYFAAAALQGLLAANAGLALSLKTVTKSAYQIADATLSHRGE